MFTKENETADNYIEKFVYNNDEGFRIRVVTSDYLEQTMIFRKGGIRVSPRELRKEIETCDKCRVRNFNKSNRKTNSLSDNIKLELVDILEKMRREVSFSLTYFMQLHIIIVCADL